MDPYEAHLAEREHRQNEKHTLESRIGEIKDSIIDISRSIADPPVEAMNNICAIIALGEELSQAEARLEAM